MLPDYDAMAARAAQAPEITEHNGVLVARDDLYPGGTKARYLWRLYFTAAVGLFDDGPADELVYASPAEGGAQTALAHVAAELGRRATIFTAARSHPHARTRMAEALWAKVEYVRPGYLNVVQARAEEYCRQTGARLVPFGADVAGATGAIAAAARATGLQPDEVWCASGSGVLARGLAEAFPDARRFSVEVGRELAPAEVAGAQIIKSGMAFGKAHPAAPPFPSDPHYDAKAWAACTAGHGPGTVLFWNVTGPAGPVGGAA